MDGCHRGGLGTRGYLRVCWLKFGTAIPLKYLGLQSMRPWIPLCLASSPIKSAHSHVLIYSESRLVVDGST